MKQNIKTGWAVINEKGSVVEIFIARRWAREFAACEKQMKLRVRKCEFKLTK